jgi:hypothetical protein
VPETIATYLAAVREELSGLPERERAEALRELESLLRDDAARMGEASAIEALGDPATYAASVREAVSGPAEGSAVPQGRILGMPYDFRGASAERVGERIWNPADPRIFTPRLFGVGWTINFGAVAVKIGLIRPDDSGDEAFRRIPPKALALALAVPALFALATVVLVATAWAGLPAEVPVHWGVSGAPDDWAPKATAVGFLLAVTVLPVAVAYARVLRRGIPARTRVLAAAVLGLLSSLGAAIAAITVADARGGGHGNWMVLVILGAVAVSFLVLYLPVRAGMRAEWRDSLAAPGEES